MNLVKETKMEKKVYTKEDMAALLEKNDRAVTAAITAIYQKQTEDEKQIQGVKYLNGVGFNGSDAPFASSLAEQLKNGWTLSAKQMAAARKMMRKYCQQLANISNQKMQEKELAIS
jgi:hypothetical protein